MEEESENRRKRLKAMRMEADQVVDADSGNSGSGSHGLCNPLAESETPSAPSQYASPRFDFYTDPMAAFSSQKRKHNASPQVAQGSTNPRPVYPDTVPSPAYSNPAIRSPQERMIQRPRVHYNQSPLASPVEEANTSAPRGNSSGAWDRSSASVNYSYSVSSSQASNYPNPGFGQGDSPSSTYGRGGGQMNNNTRYNSARGRGQWHENRLSLGSGLSGRGDTPSASVEVRTQSYYKKQMLEDPWKMVRPAPLESIAPLSSKKSWPSKSTHLNKVKASPECSYSVRQPSLAEYLAKRASSLNETAASAAEPRM